jgi:putative sigma-54 modulation protein
MQIEIRSLDFSAKPELIHFVTEKVNSLSHFNDRIIAADVHFKLVNSSEKDNKICEIKLIVPGNDLFAERCSHSFEESVVHVVEALQKQLRKEKTKEQNRQHGK